MAEMEGNVAAATVSISAVLGDDDRMLEILLCVAFPTTLVRFALAYKEWLNQACRLPSFAHLLGFYVTPRAPTTRSLGHCLNPLSLLLSSAVLALTLSGWLVGVASLPSPLCCAPLPPTNENVALPVVSCKIFHTILPPASIMASDTAIVDVI
jgi:hypothetical protein